MQAQLQPNSSDHLSTIQQSQYKFQMQKSFSQISLNSNIAKPLSQKSKQISTTNHDSKLSRPDSLQSFSSNNYIQCRNTQPTKVVVRRIQQIEAAQKQLSDKYSKVINNLLLEIRKKDQANVLLQQEITELTLEIQQSKKDLSIIVNYLKKQERKDTSNVISKGNLNSTKASDKIDKSVSGSKKKLEVSCKFGYSQLKTKSPRQLFPKQTLKW